jgi:hypothetical protein
MDTEDNCISKTNSENQKKAKVEGKLLQCSIRKSHSKLISFTSLTHILNP